MKKIHYLFVLFMFASCYSGVKHDEPVTIPEFSASDFFSQETIDHERLRGKYTVVDFWGTWCGPCVDGLPGLAELHQEYGDKINMLSIAYDKPDDLDKLRELVTEHRMDWLHIWDDGSQPKGTRLFEQFDIYAFPTIVLLDPDVMEIERFGGYFMLSKLRKRLESLEL